MMKLTLTEVSSKLIKTVSDSCHISQQNWLLSIDYWLLHWGCYGYVKTEQDDHVWSTHSASPLCTCTTLLVHQCFWACIHSSFSKYTWSASSWSLWASKGTGEDIGGNCPAWFPLYISFLHKSFHPPFSLLGDSRRKSLTCLDMEHNCPKTGPDPNEQGAKLSQTGLDTKTQTGAIRIMPQSPCNGQWWGNQVWPALFVFFDCSTNNQRVLLFRLLWGSNRLHIFFDKNSSLLHSGRGGVFIVFAVPLLHRERGKANPGRAWSSQRPVLHQTLVKHQADRQLSGSDRSDHRHGQ